MMWDILPGEKARWAREVSAKYPPWQVSVWIQKLTDIARQRRDFRVVL